MKKVKIVVLLVLAGLVAVIAYQNSGFALMKHQFNINLMFFKYQSPEIANFVLLIAFFAVGLLLAYFSNLLERFKSRKTVRELTGQITACRDQNAALEKELAGYKTGAQPAAPVDIDPAASA